MPDENGFESAADQAYRMASRWGGEYVVVRMPDGSFVARGARQKDSHDRPTAEEIGRVISHRLDQLEWRWADGRAEEPPASPFDRTIVSARTTVLATPYWSVGSLQPASRELAQLMAHVMSIQIVWNSGRPDRATKLVMAEPASLADDMSVPYAQYMANVEQSGVVDKELSRLRRTIAAARQILQSRERRDAVGASMDVMFGRTRLPEIAEPGATPAP